MFYPSQKENKESKPLEKTQLKHVILPFVILGVGCFVALIVFFLEFIVQKEAQEQQQENDNKKQDIETHSYD